MVKVDLQTLITPMEFSKWRPTNALRYYKDKNILDMDETGLFLLNFHGHERGVQLLGGLNSLQNVIIRWLPANTTSYRQPPDQGLMASLKLQYRRQSGFIV